MLLQAGRSSFPLRLPNYTAESLSLHLDEQHQTCQICKVALLILTAGVSISAFSIIFAVDVVLSSELRRS